ncbi:hypothetical protein MLD38_030152 [Melastoma candidum]|uniref:Uncharacterized protein n=1 Tax=Melastoma candidum TaxID=119954 RepID=A0ACB9MKF5_9MYRT|nr:hypothetical protein MLD38_030152 [Melastoma candidum]
MNEAKHHNHLVIAYQSRLQNYCFFDDDEDDGVLQFPGLGSEIDLLVGVISVICSWHGEYRRSVMPTYKLQLTDTPAT